MIEFDVYPDAGVLERVRTALEAVPAAYQAGVLEAAKTLRLLFLGRTPYKSGHLKREWSNVEYVAGGFSFGNPVEYADTIERGAYPHVGPRTVAVDGGIYSRQAPGGIMRPILEDPSQIEAVVNLILNTIIRGIEGARA